MNLPGKHILLKTALWTVCVTALWGCQKTSLEPAATLSAEFTNDEMIIPKTANANKAITVMASGDWTLGVTLDAADPAGWCTPLATSGSGNGGAWLNVQANPAADSRQAVIIIASGAQRVELTLIQKGLKVPVPSNRPELPQIVNPQNVYYHEFGDYTLEYYPEKKHSRWVAWPLNAGYLVTGFVRTDPWAQDPDVPLAQQPVRGDFSGYDRGHICPSADRTKSVAMNSETFYYTNMTPQVGVGFNQGIWADLENRLRALVRGTSDVLYICAGGTVLKDSDISGYSSPSRMAIPKYNFKVVVRRRAGTGAYDGIGFWFENRSYGDNDVKVSSGQVKTIRQIEELTGIDFFYTLDATTQNKVETDYNPQAWGIN